MMRALTPAAWAIAPMIAASTAGQSSTSGPSETLTTREASARDMSGAETLLRSALKRGACTCTPPVCMSTRIRWPSPPADIRISDSNSKTHWADGSASSKENGRLAWAVIRARAAGLASAIRCRSGPISAASTSRSSHDFPCPDGAVIWIWGRHSSAPPTMAETIQPRNRLPSIGVPQRYCITASAMAIAFLISRRRREGYPRLGHPRDLVVIQGPLLPIHQQPVPKVVDDLPAGQPDGAASVDRRHIHLPQPIGGAQQGNRQASGIAPCSASPRHRPAPRPTRPEAQSLSELPVE